MLTWASRLSELASPLSAAMLWSSLLPPDRFNPTPQRPLGSAAPLASRGLADTATVSRPGPCLTSAQKGEASSRLQPNVWLGAQHTRGLRGPSDRVSRGTSPEQDPLPPRHQRLCRAHHPGDSGILTQPWLWCAFSEGSNGRHPPNSGQGLEPLSGGAGRRGHRGDF